MKDASHSSGGLTIIFRRYPSARTTGNASSTRRTERLARLAGYASALWWGCPKVAPAMAVVPIGSRFTAYCKSSSKPLNSRRPIIRRELLQSMGCSDHPGPIHMQCTQDRPAPRKNLCSSAWKNTANTHRHRHRLAPLIATTRTAPTKSTTGGTLCSGRENSMMHQRSTRSYSFRFPSEVYR